jgi:hypothetical protein
MLMAEALDCYHNAFSDVVMGNFWSKTKSPEEVINQLLKKEMGRTNQFTDYSREELSSAIMRKTLESAPGSGVPALQNWAIVNQIRLD